MHCREGPPRGAEKRGIEGRLMMISSPSPEGPGEGEERMAPPEGGRMGRGKKGWRQMAGKGRRDRIGFFSRESAIITVGGIART